MEILEVVKEISNRDVDYVALRNWLVFIVLVITTILVIRSQHVGGTKSEKKLKKERKQYLQEQKQRKARIQWLRMCAGFADKVGGGITDKSKFLWDFRIARLFKQDELIGRTWSSLELVGMLRLLQFVCVAIGFSALVLVGNVFSVILIIVGFVIAPVYAMFCDMLIKQQDANIDKDFADVYLLLHSKLLQGTNAHIASTLTDYLRIADATKPPEMQKDLRQFVRDLVTTIAVVTDERLALLKMREKYKTATIINFCNIACQALDGADNADKLLTFKMDLLNRTKMQAEIDAKERAAKAQQAIYAVWVILFEVIGVVLVPKLSMTVGGLFRAL